MNAERKKVFGVIPYLETEDGDRLTRESAERTVQVGMLVGLGVVAVLVSQLYPVIASSFGATIGYVFLGAMTISWLATSYLAYGKMLEKVVSIYKDKGEYYERQN